MAFKRAGIFLRILLLVVAVSLSACATMKKPLSGIVPGKEVQTLQSSISVSVKSGVHSTGGRGYLIFKQPERFHMAVLSPFGLTVFEVFIDNDRMTCLVPSRQAAYSGLLSELPEDSALKSVGMMRWVVARPPQGAPPAGSKEMTGPSGEEYYFDDHGLVERKVSAEGDQATYLDYQNVNGVGFPESIIITSHNGASVKVVFDDPQVNDPVEESALTPNLEGYHVLPLADFKGF